MDGRDENDMRTCRQVKPNRQPPYKRFRLPHEYDDREHDQEDRREDERKGQAFHAAIITIRLWGSRFNGDRLF